ncbi:hypothetical protein TcCL_ESM07695, partial [Trypanosoma cruzi]
IFIYPFVSVLFSSFFFFSASSFTLSGVAVVPPKRRDVECVFLLPPASVPTSVGVTQPAHTPRTRVQPDMCGRVKVTALAMLCDASGMLCEPQYALQTIQRGRPLTDVHEIPPTATADKALHGP